MKVQFRPFFPADMMIMLQHVPLFRTILDMRGLVACDEETGEIYAIFTLHNWTHTAAQANWLILKRMVLRHGFLEEMGRYMFDVAKREKVFCIIPSSNKPSLKLAERLGCQEYGRMKDGWMRGIDFVELELFPENYLYWGTRRMAA